MAHATTHAGEAVVCVRDLSAGYGAEPILRNVSFDVQAGEIFAVIGRSGSGKSTLLQQLIGLRRPTSGAVQILGLVLNGASRGDLTRARKRIGVAFQGGGLLSSLNVIDNIELPLRQHTKLERTTIRIVSHLKLELLHLSGIDHMLPAQLSGGMLKRVSLARAVVMDPELLLLDEPSSGLDPANAAELDQLLLRLRSTQNLTIIYITHAVESALRVADKILVLHDGEVLAVGTPDEIRNHSSQEVQSLLGHTTVAGTHSPTEYLTRLTAGADTTEAGARRRLSFVALFRDLGRYGYFLFATLTAIGRSPGQFRRWLHQVYFVGACSTAVIAAAGAFVGMVVAVQFHDSLVRFGASGLLGTAVGLTLIRELGPLLTALIVIGRAGSASCAEIAIMRTDHQLDALEGMAIDPFGFLHVPRFWAFVCALPLLTAIFIIFGIAGSTLVARASFDINVNAYLGAMADGVINHDTIHGMFKAAVFGVLMAWICLAKGFLSEGLSGAAGVSRTTTEAVVVASLAILFFDYVLSAVLL